MGGAFVTYHGSTKRTVRVGFRVVYVPFDAAGMPAGPPQPILARAGVDEVAGDWLVRPVDLAVGPRGQLFVTSDASGEVLSIGHDGR